MIEKHKIDIVLTPELLPAYQQKGSVAVVIDVLRASATMITALKNGAKAIYPLESVEEAEHYASLGEMVGAERNVVRCPFARFGNDPMEYTQEVIDGAEVYFTTTNGTRTIKVAIREGYEVVVGTFINLSAVACYCKDRDVIAICAGWQGRPSKEDALFAAALCEKLAPTHEVVTDVSAMMVELWQTHKDHFAEYIIDSNHYTRMLSAHKEGALDYCLSMDTTSIVPVADMHKGRIILTPFDVCTE